MRHRSTWLIVGGLLLWWGLLYLYVAPSDIWGPASDDFGANGAMRYARYLVLALAVGPAVIAGTALAVIWRRTRSGG